MTAKLQLPDVEPQWTGRQKQVLDLLTRGKTNAEIGEELGIGLDGVKWHVSEILQKLNLNSREEAAEYWRYRNGLRMRFLRISGTVFSLPTLRWAGVGVAAAVGAAVAIALVFALMSDDEGDEAGSPVDESPVATATSAASPARSIAPSATPGPVLTPFPSVSAATQVSVARGSTITGGYGLLFGNPSTGGVEAWLLPDQAMPAGVSPQGRYFVYEDELIDSWTGVRSTLPLNGRVLKATFAPDDSAVVVQTDAEAAVVGNNGGVVVRFPAFATSRVGEAMWSRDSRAVALTRESDTGSRVDVVVEDALQPEIASHGQSSWSYEGLRLAVTGDQPAIYEYDGQAAALELDRGGTFPSWSPDDSYVAVDIGADGSPALGVLDAGTGAEIMRLYNRSACFSISWFNGPALQGDEAGAISVPSGDVVPYDPVAPDAFPSIRTSPTMQWLDADGNVYAEVDVEAMWAFTFAWVRRDLNTGFPPVLFLGRGGQDACGGQQAPVVVAKPPFTPDQAPTPTPTPDK